MGQRAVAIQADVGEPDDIERMVAEAMTAFGRIDILVNNAGFLDIFPVADMPLAAWEAMMATHLRGTFLTTQLVLPQMLERRRRQDHQHRLATRLQRARRSRPLLRREGRHHRLHPGPGARGQPAGRLRQLHRPGSNRDRDHSAHRSARSRGRGALRRLPPDWARRHRGRGGADRRLSGLGRFVLLRRSSSRSERRRRDAVSIIASAADGVGRDHLDEAAIANSQENQDRGDP